MFVKCLVSFLVILPITKSQYIFKAGPMIEATKGEVWPQPQQVDELDDRFFTVLPTFFYFESIDHTCDTLKEALTRYRNIIIVNNRRIKEVYYKASVCYEESDSNFLGYLTSVEVELTSSCDDEEYPSLHMNEEYTLIVNASLQRLTSDSIWGILRGLESFSQLVYLTDDHSCHKIDTVKIHDYPRFTHRGLLLDTSRHYQTPNSILRLIDTMSWNKFNVFHWHITDDYSFPYVSKKFPELSEKGAFHPTLMIYSQDFVEEVVEYARRRGIRVIVEFDTPGHTLSWGLSQPDLLTKCYDVPMLEWGPINPIKNSSYDFIFEFFEEVKEVFKDEYTHLGGDEVDFSCWRSDPEITQWMIEHGMESDYQTLQSYYIEKLIDHVRSLNLSSIVWEEVFTHAVSLPKDLIINVWINDNTESTISKVAAAGHRMIISTYWYLDKLETGGDWLKFYTADAHDFDGPEEHKDLVLGGEACMWAELVDENNLEPRVWPRASAVAERFWSPPSERITSQWDAWPIAARLQEQACRMNRRGIRAQPPSGPSVCF